MTGECDREDKRVEELEVKSRVDVHFLYIVGQKSNITGNMFQNHFVPTEGGSRKACTSLTLSLCPIVKPFSSVHLENLGWQTPSSASGSLIWIP